MQTIEQIQPGWAVYGTDRNKIGDIAEVDREYVAVSKGLLLPKTYYVPVGEITEVNADEGWLVVSCSKDEFEHQGWDQTPTEWSGTYADSTGSDRMDGDRTYREATTGAMQTERVPRYEEDLRAEKTARRAGEVRVDKHVTTDQRSMDVPVAREDVEIRRHAVDRPATGDDRAFTEGDTLRVPLTEEQVHVTKEPRVVEELEVRKTPHQETQRVSDTVRREEFDVERTGDVGEDVTAHDMGSDGRDTLA